MWWKELLIFVSLVGFVFSGGPAFAECPSADLTGDCFVDLEDFALMANQWLTTDLSVPDDMVYIPDGEFDMGDHHGNGSSDERPVHAVLLDAFFMSRFETTNQQYCDYLNSAYPAQLKVDGGIVYASSDGSNSYPYCNMHSYAPNSQIDFNDVSGTFSVRTKGQPPRDMSDDPMIQVSWYGSVAYCNWRSSEEGYEACYNLSTWECDFSKNGYRLPTEAEWEYAARGGEHNPYYRFPWGDTVNHDYTNYTANSSVYFYDTSPYTTDTSHPNWNDGISPYTSVIGSFSANGYGLYDMAGNTWTWCNDWYDSGYYDISPYDNPQGSAGTSDRVVRGGGWINFAFHCRVANRGLETPAHRNNNFGFRLVLNLN